MQRVRTDKMDDQSSFSCGHMPTAAYTTHTHTGVTVHASKILFMAFWKASDCSCSLRLIIAIFSVNLRGVTFVFLFSADSAVLLLTRCAMAGDVLLWRSKVHHHIQLYKWRSFNFAFKPREFLCYSEIRFVCDNQLFENFTDFHEIMNVRF